VFPEDCCEVTTSGCTSLSCNIHTGKWRDLSVLARRHCIFRQTTRCICYDCGSTRHDSLRGCHGVCRAAEDYELKRGSWRCWRCHDLRSFALCLMSVSEAGHLFPTLPIMCAGVAHMLQYPSVNSGTCGLGLMSHCCMWAVLGLQIKAKSVITKWSILSLGNINLGGMNSAMTCD
jgi:hypothetical protein